MPPVAVSSQKNLLVGAGVLSCQRYDAAGVGLGYFDMGNIESLSVTFNVDEIVKRSSRTHSKGILGRVVRHTDPEFKFVADEFIVNNVLMHLLGTSATLVQPATAVTGEVVAATTIPNSIFRTKKLGPITAVTVTFASTPGVLGTDYEIVDANVGMIHILPGTILTGAVTVAYTPTAYTSTTGPSVISAGAQPQIPASFRFVSDPMNGPRQVVEVWQTLVSPDGAHDYISEDFATMAFKASVLDDSTNHPTSPFFDVTYMPF